MEFDREIIALVRKLDTLLKDEPFGCEMALAFLAGAYAGRHAAKAGADVIVGVGLLNNATMAGAGITMACGGSVELAIGKLELAAAKRATKN